MSDKEKWPWENQSDPSSIEGCIELIDKLRLDLAGAQMKLGFAAPLALKYLQRVAPSLAEYMELAFKESSVVRVTEMFEQVGYFLAGIDPSTCK